MLDEKEESFIRLYKDFIANLYEQDHLRAIFSHDERDIIDSGIDIDNLSREAFIINAMSNNVCISNNQIIYVDTFIEKITYQINAKYNVFQEEYEYKIYSKANKENYIVEENVSFITAGNIWFLFEFSDAIDYIYENKCKLINKVAELNDLLNECVGEKIITFDLNSINLRLYDGDTIKTLQEKIKSKQPNEKLVLAKDERELWDFLKPMELNLSIDNHNILELTAEEKKELKNKAILFLDKFIKNECEKDSDLVIREIQSLRKMQLTQLLKNKNKEVKDRKKHKI